MTKSSKERGSFYLETIIAMGILSIVATTMMPMFPRILTLSREAKIQSNLVFLGSYVGNYVLRWVGFPPDKKPVPFDNYTDGVELESFLGGSADLRVNQLFWADPLITENPEIDNLYKTSITFLDTAARVDSAVIRIIIWYDENQNDILDEKERRVSFTTTVTEKGLII